jgi:hypothetical protein
MMMSGMSGGGGDIWSTGAFSFESPLKDLLDSGAYTLEQLLAEDELLQELRGLHPQLISYFSTPEAVTKLVEYVILPPSETEKESAQPPPGDEKEEETPGVLDMPFINGGKEEGEAEATGEAAAALATTKEREPGEWLQEHIPAVQTPEAKEPDAETRHVRFPYMACEIICCEIPGVIDTLVTANAVLKPTSSEQQQQQQRRPSTVIDNDKEEVVEVVDEPATTLLDLLFSVLYETAVGELDDYRAGYLDKILTVLSRKKPEEVSSYINTGGASHTREDLMRVVARHLYSHSIMQIAQRWLLPLRPQHEEPVPEEQGEGEEIMPAAPAAAAEEGDDEDQEGALQCDWSESPEALHLLLDTLTCSNDSTGDMTEEQLLDLSLNASEVLITMIQNSMLSSPTMLTLTSSSTIGRLVDAATTLPPPAEGEEEEYFSPHESLLTSAMNVLESLILQLGGYGAVGTMSLLPQPEDEGLDLNQPDNEAIASLEEAAETSAPAGIAAEQGQQEEIPEESVDEDLLIADVTSVLEHLPRLLENFSKLLRHPSTKKWTSPMQYARPEEPQQMLGNSRLRIVRVLESLVLLGDPDVDSRLVQSDCLEICLDFFWEFQWCSMLHQSVANLLVHVFEGQNARVEMQEYFLVKCNLLGRLMDSFVEVGQASKNSRPDDIVENLNDVSVPDVSTDALRAVTPDEGSEKGSGSGPIPVSEDDVDAAMETTEEEKESTDVDVSNVEQMSTEAVRFESRDASTVDVSTPLQSFRFGYMGHVIIICQALVHAYTNDPEMMEQEEMEVEAAGEPQENGHLETTLSRMEEDATRNTESGECAESDEYTGPKDDFGEPLLLAELVNNHVLAERWHEFVDTTLAAETAVQSTPLGGYAMGAPGMDSMQMQRPGLEEGYMMGDEGDGPPAPPRGMLGGGDVIDMDDNDLDIAASMMAGLSIGRPGPDVGDDGSDGSGSQRSGGSGDSDRSYNSGETASDRSGYAFDDPLGKTGGLGIELGKLTQYKHEDSRGKDRGGSDDDDDDGSHSSSDEEPDSQLSGSGEVPVMDLFAGNFNYGDSPPVDSAAEAPAPEFANFADFDASAEEGDDDDFGPFSSADNPAATPDQVESPPKSSEELEEIFGKGDHAELLELDEKPADSTEPTAESSESAAEPLFASEPTSSAVEQNGLDLLLQAAGECSDRISDQLGDIVSAPSDERDADSKVKAQQEQSKEGEES